MAASYLRRKLFRILQTGYRSRYGEIDIIAKKGGFIVFVEVKLRKSDRFAEAMEFVDKGKQSRILSTAAMYLAENATDLQPRFDVIEIYAPDGMSTKKPVIHHLEDAFE